MPEFNHQTDRGLGALEDLIAGKTVKAVTTDKHNPRTYADAQIVIHFTDGTAVSLGSWDYEGYDSGVYVWEGDLHA